MDYQKEYILKNPGLHLEQAQLKAKQVLNFLGSLKIDSLLDVACGAGGITMEFNAKLKPDMAVGIDISKDMIKVAKENDTDHEIEWICEDIYKYSPKANFDLGTGIDIIEHVEDDLGLLKRMGELGKLVCIKVPMEDSFLDNQIIRKLGIRDPWKESEERYGHIHHYNEKQLNKLFTIAGFKILKEGYIPLPKRSKLFYEVFRVIFLPLGWFSQKAMANFVGGFKIVLLESFNNLSNK